MINRLRYNGDVSLCITISRLSNFLFSIQATSGRTSPKSALYEYTNGNNFDVACYGENEEKIWGQIARNIGKKKTRQFRELIKPLGRDFRLHWNNNAQLLRVWENYFHHNETLLQQIIDDTKKLCGVRHFAANNIPIYLVTDMGHHDRELHAWFSWTPKNSFVVVEIPSGLKPPATRFPVSILAHEFFHLIIRKNKRLRSEIIATADTNKATLAKQANGMPYELFLEELLVSSCIPEGYLGKKYARTKMTTQTLGNNSLLAWRRFVAHKLEQEVKKYINNGRCIDGQYLENLIEIIKRK